MRLAAAVHSCLRHPISVEEARTEARRRFAEPAEDFLALTREVVARRPDHPTHRLLKHVGCEVGDLERLVRQEGLNEALCELLRRGVYLTVDELKGRAAIKRGSLTFQSTAAQAVNPLAATHLVGESGGSGGQQTSLPIDLKGTRDRGIYRRLLNDALGATRWHHAIWEVPGSLPIVNLLQFTIAGAPPTKWYLQVDPAAPGLAPRYSQVTWLLPWLSRLYGVALPRGEVAPLRDPTQIVTWMAETLRAGNTPQLFAPASACVRVSELARQTGLNLRGAHFLLTSEPATPARLAAVQASGATAHVSFGSMEVGILAEACAAPGAGAAMHLLDDLQATIQPLDAGQPATCPLPPLALLHTPLRRSVAFVGINLSIGDQAEVVPSRCGCPLAGYGWSRMVEQVRSFEKLNLGGMTLLDIDVIRVLEEVLPAHFGGGPLDYQLVETPTPDGRAGLRLLVSPRLGELNERAVAEAFFAAVGGGQGAARVRELQWREGEALRVERTEPLRTARGKVLHLHRQR